MSTLDAIVILQAVIILLLLEPQKRRPRALRWIMGAGAIFAATYYLSPSAIGILLVLIDPIKDRFGWVGVLVMTVGIGYAIALVVAWRMDAKQNRAIRAGSKEAFDKRVRDLMSNQHCSLEDATAAAINVRDGKNK